jgi:hypothetical protein
MDMTFKLPTRNRFYEKKKKKKKKKTKAQPPCVFCRESILLCLFFFISLFLRFWIFQPRAEKEGRIIERISAPCTYTHTPSIIHPSWLRLMYVCMGSMRRPPAPAGGQHIFPAVVWWCVWYLCGVWNYRWSLILAKDSAELPPPPPPVIRCMYVLTYVMCVIIYMMYDPSQKRLVLIYVGGRYSVQDAFC